MPPNDGPQKRKCPGERYEITAAICKARQCNHYPKCLLCPYHAEDESSAQESDPKVAAAVFGRSAIMGSVPEEDAKTHYDK